MEIQRLRNLTTGILHTEVGHIYEDIEFLTGEKGIMTHMLPRACEAMMPILEGRVFRTAVSAGFVDSNNKCHGHSETLQLKSRPTEDTALLKKQLGG